MMCRAVSEVGCCSGDICSTASNKTYVRAKFETPERTIAPVDTAGAAHSLEIP
jgi:hypothetical protein